MCRRILAIRWSLHLETTRFAEAELARGELVAIDGPAFRRIERATHFLCYRKTDEARGPIAAFRGWLIEELARPVS
jgi:LysR family transcriptional regulator, glycine cleavage system transcriptional activator